MTQFRSIRSWGLAILLLTIVPATALAQSTITGIVRDATGAVLPGVTVEVASPALIEKVRVAISDPQGAYRIIDLRPGVYSVTFSLPGFSTVRRENLQLPDAFTATINGELRVGSVEETITVSGQAPAVDVQSVAQRTVLTNAVLDTIPSSRFIHGYVSYLPGTSGVTLGQVAHAARDVSLHGSRPGAFVTEIDGFSTNFMSAQTGVSTSFFVNQAIIQETNIQTAGAAANQQFGGIQPNIIPKEGGNSFSGYFYGSYSNESMQADNLSDEYRAKGLTAVNNNKLLYDINPAGGGRIVRDRVWFYAAAKAATVDKWRAGIYYDTDQTDWVYTPDLSRPLHHSAVTDYDYSLRLTWQATPRNKFTVFFDQQPHYVEQRNSDPTSGGLVAAPEATNWTDYWPNVFYSVGWKSPVSSRLLLDVGAAVYSTGINTNPPKDPVLAGNPFTIVAAVEESTNICFRASACAGGWVDPDNVSVQTRASSSYVTGSHVLKVGMNTLWGYTGTETEDFDYRVTLLNGVPRSLTQIIKPDRRRSYSSEVGLYAHDQWTIKRATLNYGLRFDYQRGWNPATEVPAGPYVPARSYPRVDNLPNYKDLSPRLGIAYDLFGNGKTALKATLNRYADSGGNGIAVANHSVALSVLSATRAWNDANRDYVPDCDLVNPLANGECAQVNDLNFGKANPRNLGYNPDILTGWGVRQYNWEMSAQIQQELMPGFSATIGYFRRAFGNLTTVDNLAVTPADFDQYCVTAPLHPQLPGGGGYQICDLYDVKPAKFGQVQNQVNRTSDYGEQIDWRGVDATVNMRLQGATLSGGLSTGSRHTNDCAVVDLPSVLYCDVKQPWQTQIKLLGLYPLPWWGLQLSGVYQNLPGENLNATAAYTNAQIRPSLGRDRSAGAAGVVIVPLIPAYGVGVFGARTFGTEYLPRQSQIDLRVAKAFQFGRYNITTGVDLFNLLNGNGIQLYNNRVNQSWPKPVTVQPARSVAVNAVVNF